MSANDFLISLVGFVPATAFLLVLLYYKAPVFNRIVMAMLTGCALYVLFSFIIGYATFSCLT